MSSNCAIETLGDYYIDGYLRQTWVVIDLFFILSLSIYYRLYIIGISQWGAACMIIVIIYGFSHLLFGVMAGIIHFFIS